MRVDKYRHLDLYRKLKSTRDLYSFLEGVILIEQELNKRDPTVI